VPGTGKREDTGAPESGLASVGEGSYGTWLSRIPSCSPVPYVIIAAILAEPRTRRDCLSGIMRTHLSSSPPLAQHWAYTAWFLALVGTLSSLFVSEIMDLSPCVLCWYQRICLFPLVLVIGAGIARRDAALATYALPLALAGLGIAIYHNLLQLGIIPEELAPCTAGASCSEKQVEWLGFITIPLMALGAFGLISLCLIQHHRSARRGSQ